MGTTTGDTELQPEPQHEVVAKPLTVQNQALIDTAGMDADTDEDDSSKADPAGK